MVVAKRRRILLVGKHHLIDGVGCCGGVLQAVAGVVPTAAHVEELPGFGWVVDDVAVFLVAAVLEERVIAASLLAHVAQHIVGGAVVDSAVHRKHFAAGIAGFDVVGARCGELAEIEAECRLHFAVWRRSHHFVAGEGYFAGEGVDNFKRFHVGGIVT